MLVQSRFSHRSREGALLMSINAIPLPLLLATMACLAIVMVYFVVARKFGKK
jgi:hypothetical protein